MRPAAILNLTQYNNTTESVQAYANIRRQFPLTRRGDSSELTVERFRVSNTLVPAFVPNFGTLPTFIDTTAIAGLTYVAATLPSYQAWQMTDMYVVVQGVPPSGAATFTYSPVLWEPANQNTSPPINHTIRSERLRSSYYHIFNTLALCRMIANALDYCFTSLGVNDAVQIVKTGQGYALLLSDAATDYRVSFNDTLKRMFGFNYAPHEYIRNCYYIVVDLPTTSMVTVGGINYYATYTITQNNFLPFETVQFSTIKIPVQTQAIQNTAVNDNNGQMSLVTDFLIQVDDVDTMYSFFDFVPTSIERIIPITSNVELQEIDISVSLGTPDGISVPLLLAPNDYMSIKLHIR